MWSGLIYRFTRAIVIILLKIFFSFKVEGKENLPRGGGFILASNHTSNLDPIILGAACRRKVDYMAKEDLFKIPVFGWLITLVGAFPVKRESADIRAIKEAIKRLKCGRGLVIFPQGSRRNVLGDVHGGIGILAFRAQAPVVPAFIFGSDKALPVGARFLRPTKIRVRFGKPLKFPLQSSYPQIAHEVMGSIHNLALGFEEKS
ncbi:MAG: lysophospholipid acyltransferase family protein [Candidatus Omnitrophota bacterium]